MADCRIAVVSNPHAARHKARVDAGRLRRSLGKRGVVYETTSLDALGDAVRDFLDRGVDYVAISGGDGTLNWVLNEALAVLGDADKLPSFLPTNGGTIDFVARKVGIEGRAEDIVEALVQGLDAGRDPTTTRLDSLQLQGTRCAPGGTSEPFSRLGFALAAGGIGQRFFSKYYLEPHLGARAIVKVVARAVASHAASKLPLPVPERYLSYGRDVFRATVARVIVDGKELEDREHGAIHAGAFDVSLGGVFRVFPLARERGRIHFQAGGIVPSEMIRALPDLARGGAIRSERLTEVSGAEMIVIADGELLAPIIDGELFEHVERLEVRSGPQVSIAQVRAS